MFLRVLTVILLAAVAIGAEVDRLELQDGRTLIGTYTGGDDQVVRFAIGSSMQELPRSQVKRLDLGGTTAASATTPAGSPVTAAPATTGRHPVLRPGSVLLIRTGETLDSSRHKAGRRFSAALEADAAIDGVTVLPKGTPVEGELTTSRGTGLLFGRSELQIVIVSVTIDGRTIPCATEAAEAHGVGKGADTVQKTAAGAMIGAVIDNDSAHGAGVGAAIGAGVALLSRGDQVRLPPGTVLDVRLTQPLAR